MNWQERINRFSDLALEWGGYRVTWEYAGEGWCGDYDPKDPDDTPLLRFYCWKWFKAAEGDLEGDWEELPNGSYCTRMPINAPMWQLATVAIRLMEIIQHVDYKRRLEEMSWIEPEDFNHMEKPCEKLLQPKVGAEFGKNPRGCRSTSS